MSATAKLRIPWRGVVAALPHFGFAFAFLHVWRYPTAYGDKTVTQFMMIMLIEFFVVHSTGFLNGVAFSDGSLAKRAAMFLGLVGFYVVMVGGVSLGFGTLAPLVTFLALTFSKFPAAVMYTNQAEGMSFAMAQWAGMVACCLAGVFAGVTLPVPALGVTPDIIALQEFSGSGAWLDAPQTVLSAGVIYFVLLGLFEIAMDAGGDLIGKFLPPGPIVNRGHIR